MTAINGTGWTPRFRGDKGPGGQATLASAVRLNTRFVTTGASGAKNARQSDGWVPGG